MSNPNDLATSFVAMAKAFEELPRVQAQYDSAQTMIEAYAKQVQSVEMKLIDRSNEIDTLHATIRRLEAERDDAELRFLESEDRVSGFARLVKAFRTDAGSLIQALEPPAPMAVPTPPAEPEVMHEAPWSAAPSSAYASDGCISSGERIPADAPSPTEAPAAPTVDPIGAPLPNSATMLASAFGPSAETASKPYSNKRYYDHPTYLTLAAWLDGGGTEADYNWRPSAFKSGY